MDLDWRFGSAVVAVATPLFLAAWTVAARHYGGPDAALSAVIMDAVERWPGLKAVFLLACGYAIGRTASRRRADPPVLFDLWTLVVLSCGVVLGHWAWPQVYAPPH